MHGPAAACGRRRRRRRRLPAAICALARPQAHASSPGCVAISSTQRLTLKLAARRRRVSKSSGTRSSTAAWPACMLSIVVPIVSKRSVRPTSSGRCRRPAGGRRRSPPSRSRGPRRTSASGSCCTGRPRGVVVRAVDLDQRLVVQMSSWVKLRYALQRLAVERQPARARLGEGVDAAAGRHVQHVQRRAGALGEEHARGAPPPPRRSGRAPRRCRRRASCPRGCTSRSASARSRRPRRARRSCRRARRPRSSAPQRGRRRSSSRRSSSS